MGTCREIDGLLLMKGRNWFRHYGGLSNHCWKLEMKITQSMCSTGKWSLEMRQVLKMYFEKNFHLICLLYQFQPYLCLAPLLQACYLQSLHCLSGVTR